MEKDRRLKALLLAPTRELAVQVSDQLKLIAKHTPITVVPVIGGLAPQKQVRLLSKKPEIVVATPGRLWELINGVCLHRTHDTRTTTRHDTTRHDTTRHDTTRHDTTRHDTNQCGCAG